MAFIPLDPSEVDPQSPVDDTLMGKIKDDLDDLNQRVIAAKSFAYDFKANGPLEYFIQSYGIRRRIDGALIPAAQQLLFAKLICEVPGTLGTLSVDIRKFKKTGTPITAVAKQFSSTINSISQVAPGLSTQSISRATGQITTQSITQWKAALNIQSITLLGDNLVRYELNIAPDSDYKVGDYVAFSSASTPANNGNFQIVRVNDDGRPNVVITNASGVAQTTPAGTMTLLAWSYNFTNPVNAQFVATEYAIFASHTAGGNNGTLLIYAVNSGGNNIVVKNASGVAQAGVAGTVDVGRWAYTFSSAVGTDFAINEHARMSGHSNAANNGDFQITGVNVGGNNVIVFNPTGVAQGGAAGTVNTTRWVYALAADPSGDFVVGQNAIISSASNSNNNGTFAVVQVNRLGTNNIVVRNTNGVTQAGAAGTLAHERTVISFTSDQSALYNTSSNIEIGGAMPSAGNLGFFDVVEVNRGGGANYNVVVINPLSVAQVAPAGRILVESKSILLTPLTLEFPPTGETNTNNNEYLRIASKTSSDLSSEAEITNADVLAGAILGIDILSIPSGNVSDITVQLA